MKTQFKRTREAPARHAVQQFARLRGITPGLREKSVCDCLKTELQYSKDLTHLLTHLRHDYRRVDGVDPDAWIVNFAGYWLFGNSANLLHNHSTACKGTVRSLSYRTPDYRSPEYRTINLPYSPNSAAMQRVAMSSAAFELPAIKLGYWLVSLIQGNIFHIFIIWMPVSDSGPPLTVCQMVLQGHQPSLRGDIDDRAGHRGSAHSTKGDLMINEIHLFYFMIINFEKDKHADLMIIYSFSFHNSTRRNIISTRIPSLWIGRETYLIGNHSCYDCADSGRTNES